MKLVLQIAGGLVLGALIIAFLPKIAYLLGVVAGIIWMLLPLIVVVALIWTAVFFARRALRKRAN